MHLRVEDQQETRIHRALKIGRRMPQFSENRSTIHTVKKVVVLIRLVREASVIVKDIIEPPLPLWLMGDQNGFCGVR